MDSVQDALIKPLYTGPQKIDDEGRPSVKYIGRTVTATVNPETGDITTVWRTGKKALKTYGKGQ
jgi:Mg-chelatase subunit ChlI